MNYLYHFVPKNLVGTILYPLNILKDIYPEVYEKEVKKYHGREHVMELIIPTLNCKWNDTLHFSPVSPNDIKTALINAGMKGVPEIFFYKVEANLLEKDKTIIFLHSEKTKTEIMNQNNFTEYLPDQLDLYSTLPQAAKDYYAKTIAVEQRPLMFGRVPHILYKGSLDISDIPIMSI